MHATPEAHVQNKPFVYSIDWPCLHCSTFPVSHSEKTVITINYLLGTKLFFPK